MKETWLKLKEWWLNLAIREKWMTAVGGIALSFFIVYQIIWSPLLTSVADLRSRIVTNQKSLVWMQAADKKIAQLEGQTQSKKKSASPVIVLSVLQKEIQQAGLDQQSTQLKQAGNDSIEAHFQKVNFDKLIQLLSEVMKRENVSIAQMSVVAEGESGVVTADVVLNIG